MGPTLAQDWVPIFWEIVGEQRARHAFEGGGVDRRSFGWFPEEACPGDILYRWTWATHQEVLEACYAKI